MNLIHYNTIILWEGTKTFPLKFFLHFLIQELSWGSCPFLSTQKMLRSCIFWEEYKKLVLRKVEVSKNENSLGWGKTCPLCKAFCEIGLNFKLCALLSESCQMETDQCCSIFLHIKLRKKLPNSVNRDKTNQTV